MTSTSYAHLFASTLVAQGPNGRWYITCGNPGFNTRTNNSSGYETEAAAMAASAKLTRR